MNQRDLATVSDAEAKSSLRDLGAVLGIGATGVGTADDKPLVMVVDDDLDVRTALQATFKRQYRVVLAADGLQAVRTMSSDVAVVVLDIKMSRYDGFWTFRTIRGRYPYVPIIFYSAYQDLKDPYVVMNDYRPFAYVAKGASVDKLLDQVASAVTYWYDVVHHRTVTRRLIFRLLNEVQERTTAQCAYLVVRLDDDLSVDAGLDERGEPPTRLVSDGAAPTPSDIVRRAFDGCQPLVEENLDVAMLACPVRRRGEVAGVIYLERPAAMPFTPAQAAAVLRVTDELAVAAESTSLYVRSLKSELREQELKQKNLRARLEALQARTNPHFLYNSLSSVANLIVEDPKRAETMLIELSRVFRHVLEGSRRRTVPLSTEIHVVRDYLSIEGIRLGARLRHDMAIDDDALAVLVPPLILLPLVENAVLHGVAPRPEGGWVGVRVRLRDNYMFLVVEDDGPGLGHSKHTGTGSSWKDLRVRLRLLYGTRVKIGRGTGRHGGLRTVIRLEVGT